MIMRKKVHNTKFVGYAISLIRTLTVVALTVVADKFSYSCRMLENMEQENSNMEFFLVIIFMNSVRIQEKTDQKKLLSWTLLTQCFLEKAFHFSKMLGYVLDTVAVARRCSTKNLLWSFIKLIGKHSCWSLFLIKMCALGDHSDTEDFLRILQNWSEYHFSLLLLLIFTLTLLD